MGNNQGWILLHRTIMDTPDWLAEPFTRAQAWVDLLLLTNHKTGHLRKRGIPIEIKRGQVGYSEDTLAVRWRWSRGKVRRFLLELQKRQQITRKPAQTLQQGCSSPALQKNDENTIQQNPHLSNLITIVNYDLYQSGNTTNKTTESQQTIQEQRMETMKKNNLSDSGSLDFEKFYSLYPKHEARKKAFDIWEKINPDNNLQTVILSAVEKQILCKAGLRSRKQFCPEWPLPATWLNQRRWEDEGVKIEEKETW